MNKSSIAEVTLARFMAFCDGIIFDEEISETVSRTEPAIMRRVATSASDEAIARIARSSLMDRPDVRPAIEYELQVRNLIKNGAVPGHQVQWVEVTKESVAAQEQKIMAMSQELEALRGVVKQFMESGNDAVAGKDKKAHEWPEYLREHLSWLDEFLDGDKPIAKFIDCGILYEVFMGKWREGEGFKCVTKTPIQSMIDQKHEGILYFNKAQEMTRLFIGTIRKLVEEPTKT